MCVQRLLFMAAMVGGSISVCLAAGRATAGPIPVIFDTDIGDDIDDTWALMTLVKSPQFDVKLVTTTCGKAEYRAKVIAKLLTAAGPRTSPSVWARVAAAASAVSNRWSRTIN